MNPRDVVLVSAATVFGALASALALRFFSSARKQQFPGVDSPADGAVSGKRSSQSPFDPSKRKGSVRGKTKKKRHIVKAKALIALTAMFSFSDWV